MNTIVVEVSGGVVQQVYVGDSKLRVVLVDWDRAECNEEIANRYPTISLADLPPETRAAAQALLE